MEPLQARCPRRAEPPAAPRPAGRPTAGRGRRPWARCRSDAALRPIAAAPSQE